MAATLYGVRIFQEVIINMSYRTRGREGRTHTIRVEITIIFASIAPPPRNINEVKNLRNIIIPYSLIKIRANPPPPYSMLNPDTISDSPSAKSKGVRFDSARHRRTHPKNRGAIVTAVHACLCIDLISPMFMVLNIRTIEMTNNAKQTS